MRLSRAGDRVRVLAPAKVNLFLEVLGKRADGYHELSTLMVAVGLFDTLELRETAGETALECDEPSLSTGPDNLVMKAAALVRERFGVRQGVAMTLRKRIPMQAGLAGGSSDGAATLAGLNLLWRLGLDAPALASLGAELGSDVSFFFHGPAAWCSGRGEIVRPLRLGATLDLVLACPRAGLSTASVFKALRLPAEPVDGAGMEEAARSGDKEQIGRLMRNRLEAAAEEACPEVGRLRRRLEGTRPLGARMSGSGSVVFALARDGSDAARVARAMSEGREAGGLARVSVCKSCD
ncbi:MAG: 4-(cytidine 5'-diphospho)-2-C-methyl-D-erythritol kinase [Gemmataceae bacterium]|nr:4-(cytidine 5'-diphospho)-2-C-methyl-D-erythritol kinase [Gemmataceae bacterium]